MNLNILKSLTKAALLSGWLAGINPLPAQTNQPAAAGAGLCRFILHDYPLSAANATVINQIVAELLQRHEESFGFRAATNFQVRIRIFGRQDEYLRYARTNHSSSGAEPGAGLGVNATNLAGYYSVRQNEVVTWRQRDPSYLANNILHECSHAIMNEHFQYLPMWLSEGCAVYFSFPLHMQDAADVRNLKQRWTQLGGWLRDGSLPRLKSFLNLDRKQFHHMDLNLVYTTSWSLFQFLMSTPENRKVLNKLVDIIQDTEQEPADCAGILNGSYPGGLEKFERDWHEWIRKGATTVSPAKLK